MRFKSEQKKWQCWYNNLYQRFAYDVRSLGWRSYDRQQQRFLEVLEKSGLSTEKEVLDFGCGFADFYDFLWQHFAIKPRYTGVDLNLSFIEEARRIYPGVFVIHDDILNVSCKADYVFMLGVLNHRMSQQFDYFQTYVKHGLRCCQDTLVVTVLSDAEKCQNLKHFYYYKKNELEECLSLLVMSGYHIHPGPFKNEWILIIKK